MRNNSLDDIVKCNIDISSPASSDATFDTILIVAAPPSSEPEKMSKAVIVTTAAELLGYGYVETDPVYLAASVAFSQNPAPSSLCVIARKKTGGGETYESLSTTLTRALSEASFYGVYLAGFNTKEDLPSALLWVESNEKIMGFDYTDIENCPVTDFSYNRTFGMFSGNADTDDGITPDTNSYAALALMAKCFGYDPGTETWHLKNLSVISPSMLSTTQKEDLERKNINRFLRYGGSNCSIGGTMLSGEWIDVIRFRDWLKNEIQVSVFNALKVNRKVPYTDAGITLIEGVMDSALKNGQDIGGIASTEYDDDDNPIYGYSVVVPKASDLTETERKSRKLTGCKWSARLAGAIHAVEIGGNLTF